MPMKTLDKKRQEKEISIYGSPNLSIIFNRLTQLNGYNAF